MSLPVTRRIARAALLVAAGAAPVVGAAGTASAAAQPAKTPDLVSGLTAPLDSRNANTALDHAARDGAVLLNEAGKKAVTRLAPAALDTAAPVLKAAAPIAQGAAGQAERAARPIAKKGAPTNVLPADAVVGTALPVLLGGMPIHGGR